MIARLRGTVLESDGDRVVLDVGGVGFEVGCPGPVAAQLSLKLGETASLYTYLHVRDDILQLYGFASPRERSFFRMLISVSGVGPKVAVAILSAYPVADLELAVFSADAKRFESIPGIGKKLAQRLMVELKDKVSAGIDLAAPGADQAAGAGQIFVLARSALQNLGLTLSEAEDALRGAPSDADVAELVKFALSRGRSQS